jgi:hypothetical protein
MRYNFDMDGTIADLYGVENWLNDLQNENARPYEIARPLVNMARLARALNRARRNGNEIAVVSWLARNASNEYNERVAEAKRAWLARHLPSVHWDEIIIVPYGTPKNEIANGVLFDDEEPNRMAWGAGAYEPNEIFEVLA